MFPIDPRHWLAHEGVQPFVTTRSRDMAAVDGSLKTLSEGKFIIFKEAPLKGQIFLVKAIVPWAMQRENVGIPLTENVSFCDPVAVNGQVLFESLVGNNSPVLFDTDTPAFKTEAGASNKDPTGGKGIPFISADPWSDAQRAWDNPMFSFVVPPSTSLVITFAVLRPSVSNPLPVVYTVPPTAGAARRIDFAGVTVVGLTMAKQTYDAVLNAVSAAPGA